MHLIKIYEIFVLGTSVSSTESTNKFQSVPFSSTTISVPLVGEGFDPN